MDAKKILIEAKPFALGVRIEHKQSLIDKIQFKREVRGDYLPPATYSLVTQAGGRGVFSFCMCPGGVIAPASTDANETVDGAAARAMARFRTAVWWWRYKLLIGKHTKAKARLLLWNFRSRWSKRPLLLREALSHRRS